MQWNSMSLFKIKILMLAEQYERLCVIQPY